MMSLTFKTSDFSPLSCVLWVIGCKGKKNLKIEVMFSVKKKKLTQFMNLVENWNTETESNGIILPDPLFLNIKLEWKLSDLC